MDVIKPGEAAALVAFMGWLTSRDEVAGPFSARHEAGQAVKLVKLFCEAQGWDIDDTKWNAQIRALKQRYPRKEQVYGCSESKSPQSKRDSGSEWEAQVPYS